MSPEISMNREEVLERRGNQSATPAKVQEVLQSDAPYRKIIKHIKHLAWELNILLEEANAALHLHGNATLYKANLEKRARIVIDLPHALTEDLQNIDLSQQKTLLSHLTRFVALAQSAGGNYEHLACFLVKKGRRQTDKNELEECMEMLERG